VNAFAYFIRSYTLNFWLKLKFQDPIMAINLLFRGYTIISKIMILSMKGHVLLQPSETV
jgi:hypothetical protein